MVLLGVGVTKLWGSQIRRIIRGLLWPCFWEGEYGGVV